GAAGARVGVRREIDLEVCAGATVLRQVQPLEHRLHPQPRAGGCGGRRGGRCGFVRPQQGCHRGCGEGCKSDGEEDERAAHAAPPRERNARGGRRIWAAIPTRTHPMLVGATLCRRPTKSVTFYTGLKSWFT